MRSLNSKLSQYIRHHRFERERNYWESAIGIGFIYFSHFFCCFVTDNDYYNDTYYYLDSSENVSLAIMPNSTSPQENILITATGWSEYNGSNSTDVLPVNMMFNDGHRISIAVHR